MNGETTYRYISSSSDWARELTMAFAGGFLLATLLWLGLWYFQARPTQADVLPEKESAVQELEMRLDKCVAERKQASGSGQRLETEVAQLDQQLRQAWTALSRCTQKAKGLPQS